MNVEIECVPEAICKEIHHARVIWTMSTDSGPHSYIAGHI